jgi:hypothetical protein
MKRPKFFEDLDRSLAGEKESEPEPEITARDDAEIRAQALLNLWQGNASLLAMHARCAQVEAETRRMREAQMQAIRNTTATGAMIAAQQQNYSRGFGVEEIGDRLIRELFPKNFI